MIRPPIGQTLAERFAWYGVRDAGAECVRPRNLGSVAPNGYWDVRFAGRRIALHRLILIANVGPITSDIQARHTCGHKWCVNRSHIIPGSIADNMRDQYELGERVMNERHPNCRLSVHDARTIRDADPGISTRSLAAQFGVSTSYVNAIRHGTARRFLDVA